ncbi:MAG: transglycosylase SLT domain-containing protein [Bacteroidales bacterium]|nr:transglycosylase SLT domain-containing protein [Bacteroidales bacterium]
MPAMFFWLGCSECTHQHWEITQETLEEGMKTPTLPKEEAMMETASVENSDTMIISPYDDLFRKYSSEINWDWRLLASLVYQESNFKENSRSRSGAYGLMQMMPATMKNYGVDTTATPEKHIAAGVKYIKYLDEIMSRYVPDENERVKFVLASYNIGPGHVLDAYRIARKVGKQSGVWENNVDSCLLRKREPQYYQLPEVRHGKCHGQETFAFVTKVMKRYGDYKSKI